MSGSVTESTLIKPNIIYITVCGISGLSCTVNEVFAVRRKDQD